VAFTLHLFTEGKYAVLISGFHRKVDENCALLGYYGASSSNLLPTFRDLSRNVGKKLLLLAV